MVCCPIILSKFMRCHIRHNFKCIDYLCRLHKEYLISLTSKFYAFFLDKIWKLLLTYHALFLPLTVTMLSTLKTIRFWSTLYNVGLIFVLFGEQRTDVMQKVEHFRNKKFLIVHGTADGNTHGRP